MRERIPARGNAPHLPSLVSRALITGLWLVVFSTAGVAADTIPALEVTPLLEINGAAGNPLSLPSDVAVSNQRVYVVDGGNDRVAVFDPRGKFLFAFGGAGAEKGRMKGPVGITAGGEGKVYVADTGNQRVQVYDADGKYLAGFPVRSDGQAVRPIDVAVDTRTGEIYVTGNNNHKVMVFNAAGELQREWGGNGLNAGQFRYPATIALMPDGRIAVVDVLNTRVQVFRQSGRFSAEIGEWGVLPGQLFRPKGIAIDRTGRFYISDSYLNLVQVYSNNGSFLHVLKISGARPTLRTPTGMAIDDNDRLYVAEMLENRVSVFSLRVE